jgi:pimeloyl-ACP methyl ester carboxylesterase
MANARAHVRHRGVVIREGDVHLPGDLVTPPFPIGGVIFAHGSGSSRRSPRNIHVAQALQEGGLATLLFDLLTDAEAQDRRNVFDIALLASRLGAATVWLAGQREAAGLRVGYFGASTGAAAALWAAAEPGARVGAIVSRGGRPDLAGPRLGSVTAPTLLIVGGDDPLVLELNEQAQQALSGTTELVIVPGATHLFEERGALEQVAGLARAWFVRYLRAGAAGAA